MIEKMKEYNKLVARHKKAEVFFSNLNNYVEKHLPSLQQLIKEMCEFEDYFKANNIEFTEQIAVEGFEIEGE